MVTIMDEETIEQIKKNLNEIKDYANRFPTNAGWRWASESVEKTLVLMEPKEDPKPDDGFDMPPNAKTKPIIPLPEPSGTDPEANTEEE